MKYYQVSYRDVTNQEQGFGTTIFSTTFNFFVPLQFSNATKKETSYKTVVPIFWQEITKEQYDFINEYKNE
jgi:hypothetical protein